MVKIILRFPASSQTFLLINIFLEMTTLRTLKEILYLNKTVLFLWTKKKKTESRLIKYCKKNTIFSLCTINIYTKLCIIITQIFFNAGGDYLFNKKKILDMIILLLSNFFCRFHSICQRYWMIFTVSPFVKNRQVWEATKNL